MPRRPPQDNRKAAVVIVDLDDDGNPVLLQHFKHTLQARGWTVYPFKRVPSHPSIELVEVLKAPARGLGVYVIAGVPDYARPLAPYIRRRFTIDEARTSDHPLADAIRKAWRSKRGDKPFKPTGRFAGVDIGERLERKDWRES